MLLASTACAAQVSLIYEKHRPDAVTSYILYYILRSFARFVHGTLNFFYQNQAVPRTDGASWQIVRRQYRRLCRMKTLRHIPQAVSGLYKIADNARHAG